MTDDESELAAAWARFYQQLADDGALPKDATFRPDHEIETEPRYQENP